MSRLKGAASKGIGLLLVLLCLGFVGQQLFSLDLRQVPAERWIDLVGVVLAGGFLYGLVSMSLSLAWQQLLLWSGEARAPAKLCHGIYGRAQLGKYLPGNVFSIAGRHLLGRKNGFSNRALLWAAALEILGTAFISGLLFALGSTLLNTPHYLVEVPVLIGCALSPLVLPWIMKSVLQRLPKLRPYSLPPKSPGAYLRLYGIFFLYLPFFLAGALLLWWLLYEATDGGAPAFMIVLSISAGAWLAGYITPGASGGIGVRDALLILALKPFVGDAIIFAVVAFRVATILGDVVYFLVALVFPIESTSMPASTGDSST